MGYSFEEIIVRRVLRELRETPRVALGEGIPQLVRPHLPSLVCLDSNGGAVDVAVVEAREVSAQGDLVLSNGVSGPQLEARRWIVATLHTNERGEPKLVRNCRYRVSRPKCVGLVITELGVIEITGVGLVLKEVCPGIATDDVKMKTAASLHVADNIQLMEL
ncbi:MAG: hypothetical protein ACE5JX_09995 [Acidobacteriota bacterium]